MLDWELLEDVDQQPDDLVLTGFSLVFDISDLVLLLSSTLPATNFSVSLVVVVVVLANVLKSDLVEW